MKRRTNVTKTEFTNELKNFYEEFGRTPKTYEFTKDRISYVWAKKLFGSWNNAIKEAGLPVNSEKPKTYSKGELINQLHDYFTLYGKVPTHREMSSKGFAGFHAFKNHFGSFRNALIESGLFELRDDKHQFSDRYTKEELLLKLREYMSDKNDIPTFKVMNKELIPSVSTFDRRFGSIYNAFKQIGFDINDIKKQKNKNKQEDMINRYIDIRNKVGRVPTSRDVEHYSRQGFGYAMKTYEAHFGSLKNLQIICGFIPTKYGRGIGKDQLIKDLIRLENELGRIPTQHDINETDGIASSSVYRDRFGSLEKAISESGLEYNRKKVHITKKGTKCYSRMETIFTQMLERHNVNFIKDDPYSNWIRGYNGKHTFDFVINHNNKMYFIEIFGILGDKKYDEVKEVKRKVCLENNIDLIELTIDDFYNRTKQYLYNKIFNP